MIHYPAGEGTTPGYLALPKGGKGPGVLVLHEWWGLTAPIRQACDRLAEVGFMALAPDFYRGKTTASIEEADLLGSSLDQDVARWRGDIVGGLQYLHHNGAANPTDGRGAFGFVAFSLGGSYALDMSINLPGEIAAVATFYATYPGLDYHGARAAYLCHFAEDDPYVAAAAIAEMEQALRAAGRPATFYTYPGTKHWFCDANRPEYDAEAVRTAWERTIAFLNAELRQDHHL
jgi:carboxymethylenebutenolidase